ncbi:fam-a protein [Plasmodium vinckei brucechwatti]|uniref:Fam-a protein n=1 Tax=Plasmodium vinckei brucechwatti TaxID=119398 RepID=A0A6V7SI36_PLAVN|nr:fam-a protein [Plasmodium vinckei brucechwatti]
MNKFYIKIVFFLLSIFVYVNNKTLASELALGKSTTSISTHHYPTSEEIYEKNKHLLCANPEETKQAEKLMNEAVEHLIYHAINEDGYKRVGKDHRYNVVFYKKKHQGHTDVEKTQYSVPGSNKYNEIISEIWDPDQAIFFNACTAKRKIIRVYNPNLVLIQQFYKVWCMGHDKYFCALAAKVEISKDKTIIVMTSANINDGYPSNKEYENTIIKNANLFKTDIDPDDYIINGKLKKTFVNIAGYLIEKKNGCANITFVASIDGHTTI